MQKKILSSKMINFDYVKLHGFHGNPLFDLKNGVFLKKYSYISNNLSYNTKLGVKLVLTHSKFIWWSDMQII